MNTIVNLDEIDIENLKAYVQMRYRPSDLFDLADHEDTKDLVKDANRYRWLRSNWGSTDELDKAIDGEIR